MKLWLLTRDENEIGCDECGGFVIRAESRENAAQLANECCGDEGEMWGDGERVDCLELTANAPEGVVLTDFREG